MSRIFKKQSQIENGTSTLEPGVNLSVLGLLRLILGGPAPTGSLALKLVSIARRRVRIRGQNHRDLQVAGIVTAIHNRSRRQEQALHVAPIKAGRLVEVVKGRGDP